MSVNEIRDFIFENYYKQTDFSKEYSYYSVKHLKQKFSSYSETIQKIPDPRDSKEEYQLFIRKKKPKSMKTIKSNYSSIKRFWKPKHSWYKNSYYRKSKTFTSINKAIRHVEKLGSKSSLYSDTKINEKFLNKKM